MPSVFATLHFRASAPWPSSSARAHRKWRSSPWRSICLAALPTMSSASFAHGGYPPPEPPPFPRQAEDDQLHVAFLPYESEAQLPEMVQLIEKELR